VASGKQGFTRHIANDRNCNIRIRTGNLIAFVIILGFDESLRKLVNQEFNKNAYFSLLS
jgi:hypothetical protein